MMLGSMVFDENLVYVCFYGRQFALNRALNEQGILAVNYKMDFEILFGWYEITQCEFLFQFNGWFDLCLWA